MSGGSSSAGESHVSVAGVKGNVEGSNVAGVVHGGMGNQNTVVQHAERVEINHIHPAKADHNLQPETGETLTLKQKGSTVAINWQQWFLQRRQDYVLGYYTTPGGATVPVYIQSGFPVPTKLTVDSSLQFGMQDGILFYVYHDKSNRPFQHRFMKNELQSYAYAANDFLKITGVDLSWIVGDYLRDVK